MQDDFEKDCGYQGTVTSQSSIKNLRLSVSHLLSYLLLVLVLSNCHSSLLLVA